MPRVYTKVEILSEEVFRRKAAGETNREIGESYGLTLKQIKDLITRQYNKAKKIAISHARKGAHVRIQQIKKYGAAIPFFWGSAAPWRLLPVTPSPAH